MTDTAPPIGQLAAALAEIRDAVVRDGRFAATTKAGKDIGYDYMTADAVMAVVRAPLAAHGVAVLPSYDVAEGMVRLLLRLVHASGGEATLSRVRPIDDMGGARGNAVAAAATKVLKTAIRDLLLLPGVDPGEDGEDERGGAGRPRSATPPPRARDEPAPRPSPPPPPEAPTPAPPTVATAPAPAAARAEVERRVRAAVERIGRCALPEPTRTSARRWAMECVVRAHPRGDALAPRRGEGDAARRFPDLGRWDDYALDVLDAAVAIVERAGAEQWTAHGLQQELVATFTPREQEAEA